MQKNIPEIEELVKIISKLPGLGPKSSRRIVLKLINNREELVKPLTNTLAQVYKNVIRCNICGNISSKTANCTWKTCSFSDKKNYKQICVVESLADKLVVESTGIYKGYNHILGGTLSSLDNKKSDTLLIPSLVERVKKNNIDEIILALSATVEGQTTLHYIQDILKDTNVKISKLAKGIPVGAELEFLDDGTLFSAFKNRVSVTNN